MANQERDEERRSPMSRQEAGSEGGKARAEKYSDKELSDQAKRAAQTVEERHPGFHAEIGREGGKARGGQRRDEEE